MDELKADCNAPGITERYAALGRLLEAVQVSRTCIPEVSVYPVNVCKSVA